MPIAPGENVGPYRIIEQLGSGGMATVYQAYHPALDRYVAIKVLHAVFKSDPQFFERFQREARIVAKLEHPNIIPVYDFNEHQGEPYLVMRYVEGETLKPHLEGQPISPDEVLRLMRPVCQALGYAHQQGVLHRDIKPSNIMVAKDGGIYLTDFGLARMMQLGESTLSQDKLMGTPQYISPEQAQGNPNLDGRTDIYSLGVVLFEMFTGRVPFSADTPFATIHDHIYKPLPLPSKLNPNIDPPVERLLLKTLAKNPNDRYTTAVELLQSLETTLRAPIAATPTARKPVTPLKSKAVPPKKAAPWWVWAGAAVLVFIILAAVGLGLWRRTRQSALPQPTQTQISPGPQPSQSNSPGNASAEQLTHQAAEALNQHQLDQANQLYRQAIAADPHYLPAYFGLSLALRQQGHQADSLKVLQEATAQNPESAEAFLRLGEAYMSNNDNEAALTAFEQAIALTPSAGAYARQALVLLTLQRQKEAKTAIDSALKLNASNPEAHLAKAFYLFKTGEKQQARQELLQLIQNRDSPPYVVERARQLLEQIKE